MKYSGIHIGDLVATKDDDLSLLTQVTGWLYVHKGATLTAPALRMR